MNRRKRWALVTHRDDTGTLRTTWEQTTTAPYLGDRFGYEMHRMRTRKTISLAECGVILHQFPAFIYAIERGTATIEASEKRVWLDTLRAVPDHPGERTTYYDTRTNTLPAPWDREARKRATR